MIHFRHTLLVWIALIFAACSLRNTVQPPVTASLTAAPLQILEHTEWTLTSLNGAEPAAGSAITLSFYPDSYLEGEAGCNSYGVNYVGDGQRFQVPLIHQTRDTCDAPEIMEREAAFFAALSKVASYHATEERLEFFDARGRVTLAFSRLRPPSTGSVLPGTKWDLTSLRGQPILPGTRINLEFREQWFSGYAGCNYYGGGPDGGKYAATDDGNLQFLEVMRSAMACADDIMTQEGVYMGALGSAATYRLNDRRLEIQNAAGETVLIYTQWAECAEAPASLAGTSWRLVSVDGQPPAQGTATALGFVDDKWFIEQTRCGGYISTYQAIGHDLTSSYSSWLGQVCRDEASQPITMLASPSDYCLEQSTLRITTKVGRVFVYEPLPEADQPPVEGSTWSLLAFVGQRLLEGEAVPLPDDFPVREGSTVTLILAGGNASGSAGCNTYQATYHRDTAITFGPVAATEKACRTPEGVMEQEQRYLAALQGVTGYRLVGSQLWLESAGGPALVFAQSEP